MGAHGSTLPGAATHERCTPHRKFRLAEADPKQPTGVTLHVQSRVCSD